MENLPSLSEQLRDAQQVLVNGVTSNPKAYAKAFALTVSYEEALRKGPVDLDATKLPQNESFIEASRPPRPCEEWKYRKY